MSELFEKSLRNIEYHRVLELLAKEAVSDRAKERVLALRPSAEEREVRRRLEECTAAVKLMGLRGSPGFSGVKDVGAALQRADMGGMLNTRELLDIAGVLRAAREANAYADGDGNVKTCLDRLFQGLTVDRFLEDKITGSILNEEEIADSASPELAQIRRQMRSANARIRDSLQKIIGSAHYQKILQEPIITQRSGRYVVPVKAEYKGELHGLVHDISASGATLFIEPMQVVEANNEIRELTAREKAEIERILMELSADAAARRGEIELNFTMLVELDTIFARAKLAFRMRAMEPKLAGPGEGLRLRHARHPLLDREKAVPIDLELCGDFDTLVITGPNTGGKTVALKTLGLLTMMAQSGLHIPADDGSTVKLFDQVLSDIGDEQSIEQSLSTFSAHMKNIVGILREASSGTLVLFDELGAGTDPVEGAALAIAVIESLRERGVAIAATTHYAELKVFATMTPGVANASCEFDVATLQPTYRLLIGLPGKSNAFAISARLGLDENIIDRARSHMDAGNTRFEDVITELNRQRQQMEEYQRQAEQSLRQAEENRRKAENDRAETEALRRKAEEKARIEAQRIIDEARTESDAVMAELGEMRKRGAKNENWLEINAQRAELRRRLNEAESKLGHAPEPEPDPEPTRPVRAGDTVLLKKLGSKASVISVNEDGTLQLQAGILKISAKPSEVRLLENEVAPEVKRRIVEQNRSLRTMAANPELDLRGMTVEEALGALDNFIDGALMAHLTSVRIIHGKGTGALRAAVQKRLSGMKRVKSFRLGRYGEGENGVTIAELD